MGLGSFHQLLDRHRDDIGGPHAVEIRICPKGLENLRDHVANDSSNLAVAIEHRLSRGTIVDFVILIIARSHQ